jgi:hypothetical protein
MPVRVISRIPMPGYVQDPDTGLWVRRIAGGMPTSVASGTSAAADAGRAILTITAATTATPIVATTAAHGYSAGDNVTVGRIPGAADPVENIMGYWKNITVPLTTTIGLTGSVGAGTYAGSTASLSKEITLATDTTNKTYVLVVDCAAMALGDILELRMYTKALTGGAEGLAYSVVYAHAQADPIKYSPPVPADISFKATLLQPVGTARAFPWKVLSL